MLDCWSGHFDELEPEPSCLHTVYALPVIIIDQYHEIVMIEMRSSVSVSDPLLLYCAVITYSIFEPFKPCSGLVWTVRLSYNPCHDMPISLEPQRGFHASLA